MDWDTFEQSAIAECATIDTSLKHRLAELEQVKADGLRLVAEAKQTSADLDVASYGDSTLFRAQNAISDAHLQALLLRHDVEISVASSVVTGQIDFDSVFPPYDFQLNAHNAVHAEQSGRANLARTTTAPCKMVASGHVAFDVPIQISVLGQTATSDLFLPIQFLRAPGQPSWKRDFVMRPSRGAALCPPDAVKTLFSGKTIDGRVREEASHQVDHSKPFEVDASFIDSLFGACYLYGASVTANISFFGVARHRPRGHLAPLGPLPTWASAGIKFHQSLLAALVLSNAPLGAGLTHFDADIGAGVFRFGIAMEKSTSRGGTLVRVTLGVRVTGEFVLAIQPVQPDGLSVSSAQQGNLRIERTHLEVDVLNTKVPVPGVDSLVDALTTELARALAGDLGNYSTSFSKFVPGCTQISAEVLPSAVAVYIQKP